MNLGENNNFFRESFRGFNKDDVAEYIVKLNKDYSANENKFKEIIAKLHAEVKSKTDEIENLASGRENIDASLEDIERKYKDEINRLVTELNEKDVKIFNLQTIQDQIQSEKASPAPEIAELKNEIAKSKETIYNLSKEIDGLRERCEQAEAREISEPDSRNVNQLTFQLAECESEKLFLFNLLKKIAFMLDIESSKNKNIDQISSLSEIAPKSVIAPEIESAIAALIPGKNRIDELESENTELKEKLDKIQSSPSSEQQMYESITADLGSIIYSAKKSADELVAKAKNEADIILENAKIEANGVLENAISQRDGITEESKKLLEDFKKKYEFIKQEHENMVQKYKEISGKYALRLTELEETLNIIYDAVNDVDFYED